MEEEMMISIAAATFYQLWMVRKFWLNGWI